ncbi:hypothetical protein ACQP3J_33195, partial [Escherichia coli]
EILSQNKVPSPKERKKGRKEGKKKGSKEGKNELDYSLLVSRLWKGSGVFQSILEWVQFSHDALGLGFFYFHCSSRASWWALMT